MSLNKSKDAAAKDANVVGEGEGSPSFNVVDAKGEWFASKAQYPMIDAEGGARFEAGVPTRAIRTEWVVKQIEAGVLEEVDAPADAKGKAASTENPALDERPTEGADQTMGNGMQSAVAT